MTESSLSRAINYAKSHTNQLATLQLPSSLSRYNTEVPKLWNIQSSLLYLSILIMCNSEKLSSLSLSEVFFKNDRENAICWKVPICLTADSLLAHFIRASGRIRADVYGEWRWSDGTRAGPNCHAIKTNAGNSYNRSRENRWKIFNSLESASLTAESQCINWGSRGLCVYERWWWCGLWEVARDQ